MALEYGLVGNIEDGADVTFQEDSDSDVEKGVEKAIFNKGFQFIDDGDDNDALPDTHSSSALSSLDSKIQAKRLILKKKTQIDAKKDDDVDISDDDDDEDDDEGELENAENQEDRVHERPQRGKKRKKKNDDEDTLAQDISYGEDVQASDHLDEFSLMQLSRPLLRALCSMEWQKPTPIQSATIPVALAGNDICACAATGTGKTGAFMLPILERLIHRGDLSRTTRVLILAPTRELAVQIFQVSKQLAQFTKVTFSLAAGGLDRSSQEAVLRLGPDVVVATLGRLIDHLQNAPNFNLSSIEILVLDEADRMLDEYFEQQMKEVIARCSVIRQTMLFSATMTEKVKDLALLSLKNPSRIFVNDNQQVALNLQQEFIRVRPHLEDHREAIIAALVKRTFHQRTIIFIETKKAAHHLHIILGLLGVNVAQLHGNLSQTQRLDALERFKDGRTEVLVATDLLSRGLHIDAVNTVINMNMPASLERYIHRVGRTARAGHAGRSITLVGGAERSLFEKAVKASKLPVKTRSIAAEVVSKYRRKLQALHGEVVEIMAEEAAEKELRVAELKVNKMLNKQEEVKEKRSWFQSHQERVAEKDHLFSNLEKKRKRGDQDFK